jgi:hypothetical protein
MAPLDIKRNLSLLEYPYTILHYTCRIYYAYYFIRVHVIVFAALICIMLYYYYYYYLDHAFSYDE